MQIKSFFKYLNTQLLSRKRKEKEIAGTDIDGM